MFQSHKSWSLLFVSFHQAVVHNKILSVNVTLLRLKSRSHRNHTLTNFVLNDVIASFRSCVLCTHYCKSFKSLDVTCLSRHLCPVTTVVLTTFHLDDEYGFHSSLHLGIIQLNLQVQVKLNTQDLIV